MNNHQRSIAGTPQKERHRQQNGQPHIIPIHLHNADKKDKDVVDKGASRRSQRHHHPSFGDEQHHENFRIIDQTMMKDCIDLFEQSCIATSQVGSAVVQREAYIVKRALTSFQHRHRKQLNTADQKTKRSFDDIEGEATVSPYSNSNEIYKENKKQRASFPTKEASNESQQHSTNLSKEDDACHDHAITETSTLPNNDEDDDYDEDECCCAMLQDRAHRMKRLSSLFRQMDMLQRAILYEMKDDSYHAILIE